MRGVVLGELGGAEARRQTRQRRKRHVDGVERCIDHDGQGAVASIGSDAGVGNNPDGLARDDVPGVAGVQQVTLRRTPKQPTRKRAGAATRRDEK